MITPSPTEDLAQLAAREFTQRRASARRALAERRARPSQAEAVAGLWAGIAAWFGADLPADCRTDPAFAPHWIDFAPEPLSHGEWLGQLAHEVRRALTVALRAASPAEADQARTRALARLERPLGLAAHLPPLPPVPGETEERIAA